MIETTIYKVIIIPEEIITQIVKELVELINNVQSNVGSKKVKKQHRLEGPYDWNVGYYADKLFWWCIYEKDGLAVIEDIMEQWVSEEFGEEYAIDDVEQIVSEIEEFITPRLIEEVIPKLNASLTDKQKRYIALKKELLKLGQEIQQESERT
jgi:hypothetical protein